MDRDTPTPRFDGEQCTERSFIEYRSVAIMPVLAQLLSLVLDTWPALLTYVLGRNSCSRSKGLEKLDIQTEHASGYCIPVK
jgi:hypothetical protein